MDLKLLSYRSLTYLVRVKPRYFILFMVIVKVFCSQFLSHHEYHFFLVLFILLEIFFIFISNIILFPVSFSPRNTLSHPLSPCFYEGVPPPTYPLLPSCPILGHLSSLHWTVLSVLESSRETLTTRGFVF